MTPITSLWPCPGQGVELVSPHNYGPRPTEVTAVGGGQQQTPWAPAAATGERGEEGEGSAVFETSDTVDANPENGAEVEIQLTPPPPSPRRSPPASPALRRSRRAAAADANVQLEREYIKI